MGVISHDTILSLCELLHIQLPPLVARRGRAGLRCSLCPACGPPAPGCRAVRDSTLVAWYRSVYAPRTGGAYDSHHRTTGIAGRSRRRGGVVAARGACAAAQGADNRGSRGRGLRFGAILAAVS